MRIRLSQAMPLVAIAFTSTCLFSQTASTISFSGPHVIPYANSSTYSPAAYAAGDVTGDGKTDLILETESSNNGTGPPPQYQLLKGDGKGGFTSSLLPISDPGIDQLLIADVNGDGHPDLIHAYAGNDFGQLNLYDGALVIYLSDGHGSFHESGRYPLPPGGHANAVVVADFNHDGKPDILVSTDDDNPNDGPYTQEDIFLNHGKGTFTHSQSIVDFDSNEAFGAVGDFNGDGKLDFTIVDVGNLGFRVIAGNGDGTFRDSQQDAYVFDSPISAGGMQAMVAADFNHDGKADLVVPLYAKNSPNAQPRVATLLAKQAGGFYWYIATSIPDAAVDGSLIDLDGDGKADFLYVGNGIQALKGLGNGKFAGPRELFSGAAFLTAPMAAPLTTGGQPAIFFSAPNSQGKVYLGVLINQSK